MSTSVRSLVLSLGLAVWSGGCLPTGARGNGVPVLDERSVSAFTDVRNESEVDVFVTQGAAFSVEVAADGNLSPLIHTVVSGTTLEIFVNEDIAPRVPTRVTITLPMFTGAENAGSGDMHVANVSTDGEIALAATGSGDLVFDGECGGLAANVDGSGTMTLTGHGAHFKGTDDGSGSLEASNFLTSGAEISTSGSGSAKVTVDGDASLSTDGSGSIYATLNDGTVDLEVSGSGSIVWSGNSRVHHTSSTGSGDIVRR